MCVRPQNARQMRVVDLAKHGYLGNCSFIIFFNSRDIVHEIKYTYCTSVIPTTLTIYLILIDGFDYRNYI